MKIFKSIKWRLQIWYGFLLAMTITTGVITSCQMERERLTVEVDHDLQVQFQNLMAVMHLPPPRPREERPSEMRPPDDRNFQPEFHLPQDDLNRFFENTATVGYYYAIWSPDGSELRSTNAPPDLSTARGLLPQPVALTLTHGVNRELVASVPPMADRPNNILIGRSMSREMQELRKYTLKQLTDGLVVLILGLLIGNLLISFAFRPIEQISSAAVKISAGDLSQRINVAEAESELGQLAAVLNSTFARLEAAFAQQQQFTSDAAHELRTPVSVILTQTQTALNREREAKDYKETVEACQRAAQRMKRLISSLLELARLDAGQEQMKRINFDLSNTAHDCVELIRPLADERGVKIFAELAPLEISGDSERVAQVITNLLTNAIQYNKPDGEVRIKLEIQNGLAVLKVADTGQGIEAEDLPRVFGRFFRADQSRTNGGNAGLGLAICKAIVEAHGGTLEVSSEIDVGTTFMVRLPLA